MYTGKELEYMIIIQADSIEGAAKKLQIPIQGLKKLISQEKISEETYDSIFEKLWIDYSANEQGMIIGSKQWQDYMKAKHKKN